MKINSIIIGLLILISSCSKSSDSTTNSSTTNPGITNPPANTSKVPAAPTDLNVKANSINSISISWTDLSSNETGFKVERSVNNSAYLELASLPANTTSYIDSNLNPITNYSYRVIAFNSNGNSLYSSVGNYTTSSFPMVITNSITKFNDVSFLITGKIDIRGIPSTGSSIFSTIGGWGFIWNTKPINISDPFTNNNSCGNANTNGIPTCDFGGTFSSESDGFKLDSTFKFMIGNLKPSTRYYVRTFIKGEKGLFVSNEVQVETKPSPAISIGQNYEGGILAYYFQPNDTLYDQNIPHGIVVAPIDQSSGTTWGLPFSGILYSKLKIGLGEGKSNTEYLIKSGGTIGLNPSKAAILCDTLTLNGKSDWFLPSANELYTIYKNASKISGMQNTGTAKIYWSSTFDRINSSNQASFYFIDFSTYLSGGGVNFYYSKSQFSSYRVRAARYF